MAEEYVDEWLKKKKGLKGEKTGIRTSIYLPKRWYEELDMVKKKKGLSHTAAVEWCLSHAWSEFCEAFGLDEKAAKSEKERKRIEQLREADAAGKRVYAKHCQATSHDRYMSDLLFGRSRTEIESFADLMKVDPYSLIERARGLVGRRSDGWVEQDWQPTGQ